MDDGLLGTYSFTTLDLSLLIKPVTNQAFRRQYLDLLLDLEGAG